MNWIVKTTRTLPTGDRIKFLNQVEAPSLSQAITQASAAIDLQKGFSIMNRP